MLDLISVGEMVIDFLPGEEAGVYIRKAGGAPANAAIAVARNGLSAGFCGRVGADDFGRFLLDTLKENQVEALCPAMVQEAVTTMAFVTLAFSQLIHVFNVRSSHLSAFSRDIGRNKYLWGAVGISAALMLLVLFVPFLSGVFSVVALTAMQWLVVLGLCLVPVVVVEIFKLLKCNEINGQ